MAGARPHGHAGGMLPLGHGPRLLEQVDEPAALLLACHERIRHFTSVACRLANVSEAPVEQIAEAASSLQRYFSMALPLHERDEEDSLAPRLLESPARWEVEDALARMTEEHRIIDGVVETMMPLWTRLAAAPTGLALVARELDEGARSLANLFDAHLALEENALIPVIERSLSRPARLAILQEIRERRTPEVRAKMAALHA